MDLAIGAILRLRSVPWLALRTRNVILLLLTTLRLDHAKFSYARAPARSLLYTRERPRIGSSSRPYNHTRDEIQGH